MIVPLVISHQPSKPLEQVSACLLYRKVPLCIVGESSHQRGARVANDESFMTNEKTIPWIAAGVIAALGLVARHGIGSVYSEAEATALIQTLTQTGLYLGSAIATASATTLALMLTLLGLTKRSDNDFDEDVYKTIGQVAAFATASLIGAVLLLIVLVMPIGEFENMPTAWYPIMYNVLFSMTVGVSALLVATIVHLFLTIRRVIAAITPGDAI